ncbi:phage major capsid protein [Jannaschia sp. M317]|uniref:phage major capsid protein n=1 Tax=Jannaschia sp. M317 TaxID=2867011 RepID=UPI0021A7B418|nr:phage major capsid protein [Jannaschia sp. M317]UWQ16150.1 phage major capsid protein [Jannaschia sp. M317]
MPQDEPKTAAEIGAELKKSQEIAAKTADQAKELAEDALGRAKKSEQLSAAQKQAADEALTKLNEVVEQVATLGQKMARAQGHEAAAARAKTLGLQFVDSDQGKELLEKGGDFRGKASLHMKATITSATTDAAGSAGDAVDATRLPGIITPPDRRLTIRDLIMPGQMDGSALEYVRETGFTNNAAPVAEGAAKPQSDIQLELVSTSAKVIAHYAKASRQILDDAAMLRTYIDGRLRYGLAYKEELQLLNGDGTGQNLLGIVPQATAFSAAFVPDAANILDTLRLAQLQAVLAEYPATGHVLNPIDWSKLEMLKDNDGNYIIGQPQGNAAPSMWGLPVVATQAMAAGKFLTGAFQLGAQVFDRWQARIEVATENEDDFVKNLVTILCEERLALAVYRPEAFIYGDLAVVAA